MKTFILPERCLSQRDLSPRAEGLRRRCDLHVREQGDVQERDPHRQLHGSREALALIRPHADRSRPRMGRLPPFTGDLPGRLLHGAQLRTRSWTQAPRPWTVAAPGAYILRGTTSLLRPKIRSQIGKALLNFHRVIGWTS